MASQCWMTGGVEQAVRHCESGQLIISSGRHEVPFGLEGWLFGAYLAIGQPERTVALCRAQPAGRDTHGFTRIGLVFALKMSGSADEAMAAANGLIDVAEATHNPLALAYALHAYAYAFCDADSDRALVALRRGLAIAQDNGNRANETHIAALLCQVEARYGDPLAALDYFTVAILNYHDSGNPTVRVPLAALATFLDRLGHHEAAAILAGFADRSPLTAAVPEITTAITHLRDVLGEATYESLARKGETMTTAAMATYAYDQIDQARAELNAVSK
jgi:tetratricopeptide (TPR) repeat protein